jgi:type I restriction enzyme S subunit
MELKRYKLSEVAKVEISSVDKKTKENETPVRLCNFTDVYHNWAITSDMASSFMEASANSSEIEKFTIKKGQVAFTKDSETRDDIGIPTYIADDFEDVILGYHCALITPDETKLCGKYLNAFMHSAYIQRYFELNATGSGMRYTLSLDTLESMPLLLPSLEEQRRIGEIFSSLDKKISINRAINQNLEALAKQLYDYWFVQFDFPNEEGKPYKSSGGAMAWNEKLKRDIPASWKTVVVDDVAEVFNGATPSTGDEQNYGGDIVWITPKDLSDQKQKFVYQGERNISQAGYDSCSTHLLPINTVLMSSRAPIGLLAIAKKELCTNQGFKSFVPKEDRIATYLYYYLQFHIKQIEQLGTGTTFKEVSREDVLKFPILKPKDTILDLWEKRVSALNDRQLELQKENENLSKQRDELLPLLMNGQVSLNSDLAVIAIIDKFTSFTLSSGSKSRRKSISPKRIWRTGLSVL